jgi:hypothetical protein
MDTKQTHYDDLIARLKNKRAIAYLLVAVAALAGAGTALDAVAKLKTLWTAGGASTMAKADPVWCPSGQTVYLPDANIAVKLESDRNFVADKAILWISYPRSPGVTFDESAFMAGAGIQRALSFRLNVSEKVSLGTLGHYVFYLSDPEFNAQERRLSGIHVRAIWESKPRTSEPL